MSSSSGSSSSDSESSSGSDDDSSSSGGEDNGPASPPQPSHQQPYNSRPAIANGTSRPQGSAQLMNTLSKCAVHWWPTQGPGAASVLVPELST
jgi:ELL-associated factor